MVFIRFGDPSLHSIDLTDCCIQGRTILGAGRGLGPPNIFYFFQNYIFIFLIFKNFENFKIINSIF